MTYWHLEADHVDCLEPGKRVRHTMNPVMVFRDGAAGGSGSATAVEATGRRPGNWPWSAAPPAPIPRCRPTCR